jgi:ribulose-phosphate 3-epimerase
LDKKSGVTLKMGILIAPSLLAADFTKIGDEVKRAEDAGADMLHCDIMDGHFVPNLTFGPDVIAAIRKVTKMHLDVHLMLDNPEKFVDAFADAGADGITVHLEVHPEPEEILQKIGSLGKVRGLSLNPDMPVEKLEGHLGNVDRLLVMSVFPGFGGQSFIEDTYQRIRYIRKLTGGQKVEIQVDGGVKPTNASKVIEAGADNLVAGTATFGADDMAAVIARMRG